MNYSNLEHKNVWLYFNNTADDDNITESGYTTRNACYPADSLVSMGPTGDSELSFFFKNMKIGDSSAYDQIKVDLTTANTHKTVMEEVTHQINNTSAAFGGFIEVVNDRTTLVGGATVTPTRLEGIDSCSTIQVLDETHGGYNGRITPTADGTGTGIIPGGGLYKVLSDGSNNIATLPAPIPGTIVHMDTSVSGTFELRSSAPASVAINNGTGSGVESAIAAGAGDTDIAYVRCTCINATHWICTQFTGVGTESVVEKAA